jgi:hypothetical protein
MWSSQRSQARSPAGSSSYSRTVAQAGWVMRAGWAESLRHSTLQA